MGLESQTGNRCALCWAPSPEQRLVFKSLFKKLKILLSSLPVSAENACGGEREGFLRLVRAGRLELPSLRSSYLQCPHDKWQKYPAVLLQAFPQGSALLPRDLRLPLRDCGGQDLGTRLPLLAAGSAGTPPLRQIKNAAHSVGRQNLTAETVIAVAEVREAQETKRRKGKQQGQQNPSTPPQQEPSPSMLCYPSAHTTSDYNSEHINAYGYYYTVPYYFNATP